VAATAVSRTRHEAVVTTTSVNPRSVSAPDLQPVHPPLSRGLRELVLVTAAYGIYTASRLLAHNDWFTAQPRAQLLIPRS
jgi:hypothetical protein